MDNFISPLTSSQKGERRKKATQRVRKGRQGNVSSRKSCGKEGRKEGSKGPKLITTAAGKENVSREEFRY